MLTYTVTTYPEENEENEDNENGKLGWDLQVLEDMSMNPPLSTPETWI